MLTWLLAASPVSAETWTLHCPSNMKEGASRTAQMSWSDPSIFKSVSGRWNTIADTAGEEDYHRLNNVRQSASAQMVNWTHGIVAGAIAS